ncbi:MAG: winged helix-turn-helix domain-containing protein [Gemmatimonadaceae bacterium]
MRPTAKHESALRTPLNDILATEANVRMLRVLTESRAPLNASELARRSLLQRSSVHRALKALETTGLIARVGAGVRSQVRLSSDHPLAPAIEALFGAERGRVSAIISGLKRTVAGLRPPPTAAWLEGPVANRSDRPGDALVLRIIDGAAALGDTTDKLWAAVEDLERRLDVTVEVRGSTPADLAAMLPDEHDNLRDAIPLLGVPPLGFLAEAQPVRGRPIRAHADLDARARAIASALAGRIGRNPSLIRDARARIALRLAEASSGERRELEEWDRLLRSTSPARLRRFLVDPGERATRLRQTLPFLGVLTDAEKREAHEVTGDRIRIATKDDVRPRKTTLSRRKRALSGGT